VRKTTRPNFEGNLQRKGTRINETSLPVISKKKRNRGKKREIKKGQSGLQKILKVPRRKWGR